MSILVLMPVYQAGRYLDQTLFKLRKMDPQPDRYIFAENNSPDRTLQTLAKIREPKEIIRTGYRADALNPLETEYDLIGIERELLLTRARQANPEFRSVPRLGHQGQDTDLLDRLTYWKDTADIIGGPYLRYYAEGVYIGSLWPAPANLSTPQKPFALYKRSRKYPWTIP